MNYGQSIKTLRKALGITQMDLSRTTGISQTTLSKIETDEAVPQKKTLQKLARALKTTESLLMVMALEREDMPEENRLLYDQLFPVIQDLCIKISK